MRNTHFGDGGFGFGSKFKADISLDSDRKISRKRGTKANVEDQSMKDYSYTKPGSIVES